MKQPQSKVALIRNHLIRGIRTRQFTDKLPSENQLADKFSVSRMTARKAISDLESKGMVERIQGKGSFVRKQDFSVGYFSVQPSRQQADQLGVNYSARVLELVMLPKPPGDAAEKMAFDGETVLTRRVHLFDGKPVRYEIRYLRGDLCGGILWENLEEVSIHELLVGKYALPLSRVWQRITATTLDAEAAAVFGEEPGYPAFHIERLTFSEQSPVTYVRYYIRGEIAFEDIFSPDPFDSVE